MDAKASPRERLLEAANELFYREGVHSVGIDRVIEHAGVAKASLYSTFGSKDELVRCYLERRHEARRAHVMAWLERYATPRERLLGVFDVLGEIVSAPEFRGCAFVNALAESRTKSPIESASAMMRAWVRQLFVDLAADAGVADPEALARRLVLLYDGALHGAYMDHDPARPALARELAAELVGASAGADRRDR